MGGAILVGALAFAFARSNERQFELRMAGDQPDQLAADVAARQRHVHDGLDVVGSERVLRDPHRPDEHHLGSLDQQTREGLDAGVDVGRGVRQQQHRIVPNGTPALVAVVGSVAVDQRSQG